jgi:hypothetical protein
VRPALILCLILSLTGCAFGGAPVAGGSPGAPSAAAASGPRISPPPVTPATPPGTSLPDFACADAVGGMVGVADVFAARASEQPGYDRFVLQFASIVPTYTVKRQTTAAFKNGATGESVTLVGNAGVLVTVHSATAATTFTGPTDLTHPEFQILVEARQVQDYEGYVSWGLGLSHAACLRAFTLADPPRLVIDFATTSS